MGGKRVSSFSATQAPEDDTPAPPPPTTITPTTSTVGGVDVVAKHLLNHPLLKKPTPKFFNLRF